MNQDDRKSLAKCLGRKPTEPEVGDIDHAAKLLVEQRLSEIELRQRLLKAVGQKVETSGPQTAEVKKLINWLLGSSTASGDRLGDTWTYSELAALLCKAQIEADEN
jgi:hypothetical protein